MKYSTKTIFLSKISINNILLLYSAACLCLISFLLSFIFANQAGPYMFVLFDEYVSGLPLLIIVFAEIITISYIYGLYRYDCNTFSSSTIFKYIPFCLKNLVTEVYRDNGKRCSYIYDRRYTYVFMCV